MRFFTSIYEVREFCGRLFIYGKFVILLLDNLAPYCCSHRRSLKPNMLMKFSTSSNGNKISNLFQNFDGYISAGDAQIFVCYHVKFRAYIRGKILKLLLKNSPAN